MLLLKKPDKDLAPTLIKRICIIMISQFSSDKSNLSKDAVQLCQELRNINKVILERNPVFFFIIRNIIVIHLS
jgi:hypothetical protein